MSPSRRTTQSSIQSGERGFLVRAAFQRRQDVNDGRRVHYCVPVAQVIGVVGKYRPALLTFEYIDRSSDVSGLPRVVRNRRGDRMHRRAGGPCSSVRLGNAQRLVLAPTYHVSMCDM